MRRLLALTLVAACLAPLPAVTGCVSQPAAQTEAQEQVSFIRDAIAVNQTCIAAYSAVYRAYQAGLIPPAKMVPLGPYLDAVEAGRKELTRAAQTGDHNRYDALLSALNNSLAQLASAQLDAAAEADRRKAAAAVPPSK